MVIGEVTRRAFETHAGSSEENVSPVYFDNVYCDHIPHRTREYCMGHPGCENRFFRTLVSMRCHSLFEPIAFAPGICGQRKRIQCIHNLIQR